MLVKSNVMVSLIFVLYSVCLSRVCYSTFFFLLGYIYTQKDKYIQVQEYTQKHTHTYTYIYKTHSITNPQSYTNIHTHEQ